MLNIGAFTFNYEHLEDRILLVGNLSNGQPRIDFWLTRKLVMRLLDAAQGLVEKTSGAIAGAPMQHKSQLAQFHHENAQQGMQLEREDQSVVTSGGALLSRLDISHQDGQYRVLFFTNAEEPIAVSVLSYDELHQILYLLHRGAQVLDWGVKSSLFDMSSGTTVLQ